MKSTVSTVLALVALSHSAYASPSLFHHSDKNVVNADTESAPAQPFPEGRQFWGANATIRKPQFEKYGVCQMWYGKEEGCPELFPRSCGSGYCAKTKENCRGVSEAEKYYFCDVFHSSMERNSRFRTAYYHLKTDLDHGNFRFTETEKLGISTVASGLCSVHQSGKSSCPSGFIGCGEYCAKSKDACQLLEQIWKVEITRSRSIWPLRLNAKTCDTVLSQVSATDEQSK